MAKDAVETMGMLLPGDVSGRDAVHVAVVSARSAETLYPGQHVGLEESSDADRDVIATLGPRPRLGIVDPFLTEPVYPGARFWLYLYPRTITGLRHVWTHPAFEEAARPAESAPEPAAYSSPAQKLASEQWLRAFCEVADCPGYDAVLEAAEKVADGEVVGWDGEFLHFDGRDAHGEIPPEFWDHVAVVLGKPIRGERATHFSCSC